MIEQPRLSGVETAFLGSLLLSPDRIDEASEAVHPADFYSEFNREAYKAILRMHASGAKPDLPLLCIEMEKSHGIDAVDRVCRLFSETPTSANLIVYAKQIRRVALVRRVRGSCQEFLDRSSEDPLSPTALPRLVEAVQGAEELADRRGDCFSEFVDTLEERMRVHASGERPALLPTGYAEIDEVLGGGLGPGIHVLAAWSSMGKSAVGTTILIEALRTRFRPRIYCFDMPGAAYLSRIAQRHAGVGYAELLDGSLSTERAAKVVQVVDRLRERGLAIVDRVLNPAELEADAWRHRASLGCIVIDHLGKVGSSGRSQREYDATCEAMRAINSIAKRLRVPIVLMAQLNNPPDRKERDDQKQAPMPSENEIRGGRQVTADASTVILPWRADYGRPDGVGCEGRIILAKNQAGRLATAEVWWDGIRCEFRSYRDGKR